MSLEKNTNTEGAEREELLNKRIAVVGAGGVGGYLASLLGQVCPHLTLAARGARREAILKNGLVLHSDYKGEMTTYPERVVPVSDMGEQDYIFVCVKNYSLEEVCEQMKDAVTEETVIVPIMNGVDPGDRIRNLVRKGTVVDSLIYIVAFANQDYSVTHQGDRADVRIGIKDANETQARKVEEVSRIFSAAQIDHAVAKDIEREIWRKYILNCAYNVATAYYDNNIGQLRSDPVKAREYECLISEAYEVARAKGVNVKPEHRDQMIYRFHHDMADDATSSLQRDIRAGKKAEVDTFSGYIVREGKRLGVKMPVSEKMYEGLKEGKRKDERPKEKKAPSMDEWLKEAKKDENAAQCGMYLFHNGVVRASAKAKVRLGDENAGPVAGMEFSYDDGKIEAAKARARSMPGIYYVRVWLNEGRLNVGDDIMLVLIGGDIRPHVVDALQALVGEIKNCCVQEKEIPAEPGRDQNAGHGALDP